MKKVMLGLALALVAAGAWAQTPPTVPDFQAGVGSAVGGVADLYGLDEDNYLDVTGWSGVEYEKYYFFLGGKAGVSGANGFQGGFAAKAFGGHLGLYFNGNLFSGNGEDLGKEKSEDNEKVSSSTWNTAFALLYASEAIGGVRFDIILSSLSGTSEGGKNSSGTLFDILGNSTQADVKGSLSTGNLITTLQWGKDLGFITPKVMVGFKWPEYTLIEVGKDAGAASSTQLVGYDADSDNKRENWDDAALAVKLEAGFAAIPVSVDNTFVMNFGKTQKGSVSYWDGSSAVNTKDYEEKATGWIYDNLNVYYTATVDVDEKVQIKLRPQLSAAIFSKENKTTYDAKGIPDALKEIDAAPEFWFSLSPIVELAAKYQVSEKFALYGGVKAVILTVNTYSKDSYKANPKATGAAQGEVKDKPSEYEIIPLSYGNMDTSTELKLGASFAFSPAFSLNASLSSGVLNVGVPGANYAAVTPVTSWLTAGSLVLNFKPGAK